MNISLKESLYSINDLTLKLARTAFLEAISDPAPIATFSATIARTAKVGGAYFFSFVKMGTHNTFNAIYVANTNLNKCNNFIYPWNEVKQGRGPFV